MRPGYHNVSGDKRIQFEGLDLRTIAILVLFLVLGFILATVTKTLIQVAVIDAALPADSQTMGPQTVRPSGSSQGPSSSSLLLGPSGISPWAR